MAQAEKYDAAESRAGWKSDRDFYSDGTFMNSAARYVTRT